MPSGTIPQEKINLNVAKYKQGKEKFEIVIDPDLALRFRDEKGKANINLYDIVKSEHIFSDANKGMLASEESVFKTFGTTDFETVIKKILIDGEISLTTKYREKIREQKLKKVVEIIHKNAVDPRTDLPLSQSTIENAIKKAKVNINEFKSTDELLKDIVKQINKILPLSFKKKRLNIVIPAIHTGRVYGKIKELGEVISERWNSDGSLTIKLEVFAGRSADVIEKISNLTKGDADIKIE